jgi:DNA modification methylase
MKTHQLKKLEDLRASPTNPRTISEQAKKGLRYSLDQFGDISGIVWNERSGNLVCGHQRLNELKELGAELKSYGDRDFVELPDGSRFGVRKVSWDEDKEAAANLAANNQAIAGRWTTDTHAMIARLRESRDEDFQRLRLAEILREAPQIPRLINEDKIPEPPKIPVTKVGDIWTLGDHTVICGDSRKDYKALPVDCVLTDPPYGVDYTGPWKKRKRIENDSAEGLAELLHDSFRIAIEKTRLGACWYVCAPAGPQFLDFAKTLTSLGVWRQTIVWLKESFVVGRSDYHYRHEAIFYGWTPGGPHRKPIGRNHTTIWEFDRPKSSQEHPTMKPVALFAHAIQNSTQDGHQILDPFLGSGTTLIAAEQTGRVCTGVELSPAYVDVVIERWENLTNGKAKRATQK